MKLRSFFNIAILSFIATALSVVSSHQAKAIVFSGTVAGNWGIPTPGKDNTDPIYTGVGTNVFTWGDPTLFKNASANQLVFAGSSFSTDTSSLFKIGDLIYRNGTVLLGTSVESVPLNLKLSFNEANQDERDFNYEFYLQNTPNLSDDPELNADFVFVTRNNTKSSFVYGGNTYNLFLTGFSQDNGKKNLSEFRVLEGEKTTAAIFAQINQVSLFKTIPEPDFSIGLSIIGIYLIYRKKAKKIK